MGISCGVESLPAQTTQNSSIKEHTFNDMEILTWRLLCSSFLVMTCFLLGDYNILPKKELHRSLQVIWFKVCSLISIGRYPRPDSGAPGHGDPY